MNKIIEYYIKTIETIKEEVNGEGEITYFIKGEISENGKKWKKCLFIWDGNINGKN